MLFVSLLRSMSLRRPIVPRRPRRYGALLACLLAAAAAPAAGQSSRTEIIAAQEAAKAKRLAPPVPNKAEALVSKIEGILLESPSGLYPFFGSVWSGGGFTSERRGRVSSRLGLGSRAPRCRRARHGGGL